MKIKSLLKTLFIIHFSFFICALAHAKTAEELIKELDAKITAGAKWWIAAQEVYDANSADVATAYASWKDSDNLKFAQGEEPVKNLTDVQKKNNHYMGYLVNRYLNANKNQIATAPLRVVILHGGKGGWSELLENNPTIIKVESDIEHIKHTTDKIEATVSELLRAISDQSNEIVEVRGRVRELEHENIEIKKIIAETRALVWKIATVIVAGSGGAISILEFFGK